MSDELIISDNKQADNIKDAIYEIRGQKVMFLTKLLSVILIGFLLILCFNSQKRNGVI